MGRIVYCKIEKLEKPFESGDFIAHFKFHTTSEQDPIGYQKDIFNYEFSDWLFLKKSTGEVLHPYKWKILKEHACNYDEFENELDPLMPEIFKKKF